MENNTIEGKQCTITWYIDDNTASHITKVIDHLLEYLKKHFGDLGVNIRGKYCSLGMKIQITDNKIIEIYSKEKLKR